MLLGLLLLFYFFSSKDKVSSKATWSTIKTFFRQKDIIHMRDAMGYDWADYNDVKQYGDKILEKVKSMNHYDVRWTDKMIKLFKKWKDKGYPK